MIPGNTERAKAQGKDRTMARKQKKDQTMNTAPVDANTEATTENTALVETPYRQTSSEMHDRALAESATTEALAPTPEEEAQAAKKARTDAIRAAFDAHASATLREELNANNELAQAAKAGIQYGRKLSKKVLKAKVDLICKAERSQLDDEAAALIEAMIAESSNAIQ